jgi:hypothetical protein
MGKGSAPKPPDPYATASAQTGQNIGTAVGNQILGNVNQNTPYGSLAYNQTGTYQWTDPTSGKQYDIPQFTADQTLSPEQQKLYNIGVQGQTNLARLGRNQSAKLGELLGSPMDLSGAPDVNAPNLQTKLGDAGPIWGGKGLQSGIAGDITNTYGDEGSYADQRMRVEDALMARLNPSLERDRASMEARLSNQGIKLGSAAYDRGADEFTRQSNDARLGAILGAGEEQSRLAGLDLDKAMFQNAAAGQKFGQKLAQQGAVNAAQGQRFGQGLAGAQFGNAARQTGFGNDRLLRGDYLSEQYANRNQPINEISALLGGGQVTQPNFVNTPTPQMPTTDVAGLINQNYNQQLGAFQMNQANNPMNGIMGGLFGLGQAGIMASDRRLKTDVERVGMWKGLPLYLYRYVWGGPKRLGVMAQDVLRVKPSAVVPIGGYLAVDYGAL